MLGSIIALGAGLLADLILGDPNYPFHPIRLIGHLISKSEKGLRKFLNGSPRREFIGGVLLTLCVVLVSAGIPAILLFFAYRSAIWLGILLETIFCYQLLAVKSLKAESMKVYKALKNGTLEEGRKAVSMIVGRDTKQLEEDGVVKAAVETVAENTSDGAVAPLFYMALGGAVFGFAYKAVNTLDSMVGYKNEKYLYFGRTSAKLDDVLNYIPSRISALFMTAVCPLFGMSPKSAWRIYRRDSRKHASPNSAQTEAVCAGALQIQLAGDAYYFGKKLEKPFIGDNVRPVEREDIKRANRLLYGTSILSAVVFLGAKVVLYYCLSA